MALRPPSVRGILQELSGRGQAVDVRLELLAAEAVTAYVTERLGGRSRRRSPRSSSERTEGNALFLVNIVEHLVQQGWVVRREGAWTLRAGTEDQVASLPEGLRQLLRRRPGAAARGGAGARSGQRGGQGVYRDGRGGGSQVPVEDVEAVCDGLAAQQHLLTMQGCGSGRMAPARGPPLSACPIPAGPV